jgi:hypothetical protein
MTYQIDDQSVRTQLAMDTWASVFYDNLDEVHVSASNPTREALGQEPIGYTFYKRNGQWEFPTETRVQGGAFKPTEFDKLVERARQEMKKE